DARAALYMAHERSGNMHGFRQLGLREPVSFAQCADARAHRLVIHSATLLPRFTEFDRFRPFPAVQRKKRATSPARSPRIPRIPLASAQKIMYNLSCMPVAGTADDKTGKRVRNA